MCNFLDLSCTVNAGVICVFSPLSVRLPRHPGDCSDSTIDPWCRQGTLKTEKQFIIRSSWLLAIETHAERPGDSWQPDGVC